MERNCKNCKNQDCYWVGADDDDICDEYLPKTNADKIRTMTDEELAKTLNVSICPPGYNEIWACEKEEELCHDCWLDWLKRESEGE